MKKLEKTSPEYIALSKYAKRVLKQWAITLMAICFMAAITGTMKEAIVIILIFAPMRKFAGGYHCKKFSYCLISSTVMLVGGAITAKYHNYMEYQLLYGLITVVSVTFLTVLKPIVVKDEQTSDSDIIKYSIIVKAELLLYLIIIIILSNTKFQFMISSVCIGVTECFIVFLLGKITHLPSKGD